jgi:hypothetical protein
MKDVERFPYSTIWCNALRLLHPTDYGGATFYAILAHLIPLCGSGLNKVLPHNLMCNPLTGQAVSRKVK